MEIDADLFLGSAAGEIWKGLWTSESGPPGSDSDDMLYPKDLLEMVEAGTSEEETAVRICNRCSRGLRDMYSHCLQCQDFDLCAGCYSSVETFHTQGHEFHIQHPSGFSFPMDGSDLDMLKSISLGVTPNKEFGPQFGALQQQLKSFSSREQDRFISSEIERAENWNRLHALYRRFEACVASLTGEIQHRGIPVPSEQVPLQTMLRQNWNVGNAKEAAFYSHKNSLTRRDHSQSIDKTKFGNVLQRLVKEFLAADEDAENSNDPLICGFPANTELPATPNYTIDEDDGSLRGSSLSVDNIELDQWKNLRDEKENTVGHSPVVVNFILYLWLTTGPSKLDLAHNMQAFQGEILGITALFGKRPELKDFESAVTITQGPVDVGGTESVVQQAQLTRRLGHFKEALNRLSRAEANDARVVFEKFRVFETMGDFRKCLEVFEDFKNALPSDTGGECPEVFLLRLAGAYIACFVKGEWKNAMDLALVAYEKFLKEASSYYSTLVQIELYYQRIWLAVSRDLCEFTLYCESSKRLNSLRKALEDAKRFPEAYDILNVELDLIKWPHRHPIVPSYWTEIDITHWDDIPETVCPLITSFLEKIEGTPSTIEEAFCRLRLAENYRRVATIDKDPHSEETYLRRSSNERDKAQKIFSACGSDLGLAQILLFDAIRGGQYNNKEDVQAEYDRISTLFSEQDSLAGMQDTLLSKAEFLHKYFREPVTKPYSDLAKVAHQAGNIYQWDICRIKMVEWWLISSALVDACESVFRPSSSFLSYTLGIISSWNLSRAFQTLGDFTIAETASYYHVLLVCRQSDQDHIYRALLNWFRMRDEVIAELPSSKRPAVFADWAQRWIQWLVNITAQGVERTTMGWRCRTADILWILEMTLWLPRLGSNQVSGLRLEDIGFPPALHVVIPLLELGLGLLEVLPKFFWPILLDQFGLTLGAVLQTCGNLKLAMCSYGQSLIANHPGNLIVANAIRITLGNLLSQMLKESPSHCHRVIPLVMKLLSQAESFFWNNTSTEDSFKDAVWASVSLGSFLLLRLHIDLPATSLDPTRELASKAHAENLIEACSYATRRAVAGWQGFRQEIFALSLSDTIRRKRLHLSGRLGKMLLSIHLELSITVAQHKETGILELWRTVQEWKAISLSELLGSPTISREDAENLGEEARGLLQEEHDLAEKVSMAEPFERPKRRMELRRQWVKMDLHPGLRDLMDLRVGHGATLEHLKHIQRRAKQISEVEESLVFVDWAHHRDAIFLFAIRAKEEPTIMFEQVSLRYKFVEEWLQKSLGVQRRENGTLFRKRLESAENLKALSPLIDPLQPFIQHDETLVLCPTGILNEVPLHAIPFSGTGDPLLIDNPIIYSSSNAILKSCVDSAYRKTSRANKVAAFGRYGKLDEVEDTRIQNMVTELAKDFNAKLAVGKQLTRDAFLDFTKDADLVHYHGHASVEIDDKTKRSLILEPIPENNDNGRFTLDDIFKLRLNAAHVTLLACASSDQDVTPNDDPLGILTAFLCAGGSSIIGTLWPTESRDAREFCEIFYQQAFEAKSVANLARALRETVLILREGWDGSDPFHWAQFVLRKFFWWKRGVDIFVDVWFGADEWFIIDGAWFCKGIAWRDGDGAKGTRA